MSSLKQIFKSILPENIKDIPLVDDAIDIFIDNLEKYSDFSINIKDLTKYENYAAKVDDAILEPSATEIRENILKVYLSSLYTVLSNAQTNKGIEAKLATSQAEKIPLKEDITKIINDEYIISNKLFKQKVGTKLGMEYAYNLAKYLQDGETEVSNFELEELQPFHYKSSGTAFKEIYEQIIKPLSHPVGFTYSYIQALSESLTDVFGLIYSYEVTAVEVRCLSGYIDVFTDAADDTLVKIKYLASINTATNDYYTEEEYNELVNVYTNKVIDSFEISYVNNVQTKEVLFTDGTYLKQTTDPIVVYYRSYSDEIADNDTYIKEYIDHCSLFVDYEEEYAIGYEEINEFLVEFDSGSETYNITDPENLEDDLVIFLRALGGYYLYGLAETDGLLKYITTTLDPGESPYPAENDPNVTVIGRYLYTEPDPVE